MGRSSYWLNTAGQRNRLTLLAAESMTYCSSSNIPLLTTVATEMSFIDQPLSNDVFIFAVQPLQQSLVTRLTKLTVYPQAHTSARCLFDAHIHRKGVGWKTTRRKDIFPAGDGGSWSKRKLGQQILQITRSHAEEQHAKTRFPPFKTQANCSLLFFFLDSGCLVTS